MGLCGLLVSSNLAHAQDIPGMTINDEIALGMAADLTFGSLPKEANSPADLVFYPALYQPVYKDRYLLPLVGLQYRVSPNLSLLGGVGGGIADGNVVQFTRIGLRYFTATLPLGPFKPEIFITQNRIEGLSLLIDQFLKDSLGNEIEDPENYETRYDSKWNEFGWGYQGQINKYSLSVAVILIYQRTFTGNAGKLTGKTQLLSFALGRDIFKKVQLSIHARVGPLASTGLSAPIHGGGIQLSLPI
jgi:hypothetical protein